MRRILQFTHVAAMLALLLGSASAVSAQQQDTAALRRALEQQIGRPIDVSEVLERIRRSGMTRSEMRAQLRRMGLDESLADRYYDMLEDGRIPRAGDPDDEFLLALRRMGLIRNPLADDSLAFMLPDSVIRRTLDSLEIATRDTVRTDSLEVFGRSFFRDTMLISDPMLMGPVDRDYRVGPGDLLILILTGAVEEAYDLSVGRDGSIVIPEVGQIYVAGLTLEQVEARLLPSLRQAYSDVGVEGASLTRMTLTVGRVRAVQVYVAGDVVRSGAYQVSALSTVMDALQRARGPTDIGSFRRVQVRRRGEPARSVDLYDYLVRGEGSGDIRLEQGDIVFVPPVGAQVRIEGQVHRPAIYEMLPNEDVVQALDYAGGIKPAAAATDVRIERIVPPGRRAPGVDRIVLTADLVAMSEGRVPPVPLEAGDRIVVDSISPERRRYVSLTGAVNRPGDYEWEPGLTLEELIAQAQGPSERAYLDRAHVYRLLERDGTRSLLRVGLDQLLNDTESVALVERDSVVVYSRDTLRAPEFVAISGSVKNPGRYRYAAGMSPQDLILAAGGFVEDANHATARVVRPSKVVGDTAAYVWEIALAPSAPPGTNGDPPAWSAGAQELTLLPGDEVLVLQAPGWMDARSVFVTGEVAKPGPYGLVERSARLADVLARAGGLTEQAYVPGIHIIRNGARVAASARTALAEPSSPHNVTLMDGDSIHVPRYNSTVRVAGAVYFPSDVAYRAGADLSYYIEQAGGYRADADEGRTAITGPDGRRQTADRGFLRGEPVPTAGSLIFVPERLVDAPSGVNWGDVVARGAGIVSAIATLLFAVQQMGN